MATIEQRVMASVGVIYTARQFVSAAALKLYACAVAALALWQLTWVHYVFANFYESAGHGGAAQFVLSAFTHTHAATLAALLVLIFAGVSLTRDLLKPTQTLRLA